MKTGFLIVFLSVIFYSCCKPGAQIKKDSNLNIDTEILEIYLWLNLMPGTSDPSIHLTSKFLIKNNEEYPLSEISIKQLEILTDSTRLLISDVDISSSETGHLKKGGSREFSVKAAKDLKKKYAFIEPATIYFYFVSNGKINKFKADNINIERVY